MKKIFRFLLHVLIIVLGVYFFIQTFFSPPIKKLFLKEVVDNSLAGTQGIYAAAVKNLETGETYYLNEHQIFPAGSLYKLWVMATAFKQIEEGQLKEDLILSEDAGILNAKFGITSESAEINKGTVTLTVADALNQMIVISHNLSALLLTEKIKLSSVAAFLKDQGLNESKVGTLGEDPSITASDLLLFWEKLYKGELGSEDNTKKMLDLLKNQQLNDKIPKNLPSNTKVAHKTGEIGWFSHDGGIVFAPSADYIIVVLSESDFPKGANDRIAQVSKAVYDYFKRSPVVKQEEKDIEIIAENLSIPWELAFLPDEEILVTQRLGTLLLIKNQQKIPVEGVEHIGEGGLLEGSKLGSSQVILQGIAGASNHDGGRIAFGPDGYLYITTGDAQNPQSAQDINSLNGKILRIKDDGAVGPQSGELKQKKAWLVQLSIQGLLPL